jgi:hypothetical protein
LAWAFGGFAIGIGLYAALLFGPLFGAAGGATPIRPASPLSRMTSMERAQRQRYE